VLCDFREELSVPLGSVIVFVTALSLPFFAANAAPTKPPPTNISDEAIAMAKRAAFVLLLYIAIDNEDRLLRNMKINNIY
jgi:hypothetical protein